MANDGVGDPETTVSSEAPAKADALGNQPQMGQPSYSERIIRSEELLCYTYRNVEMLFGLGLRKIRYAERTLKLHVSSNHVSTLARL